MRTQLTPCGVYASINAPVLAKTLCRMLLAVVGYHRAFWALLQSIIASRLGCAQQAVHQHMLCFASVRLTRTAVQTVLMASYTRRLVPCHTDAVLLGIETPARCSMISCCTSWHLLHSCPGFSWRSVAVAMMPTIWHHQTIPSNLLLFLWPAAFTSCRHALSRLPLGWMASMDSPQAWPGRRWVQAAS